MVTKSDLTLWERLENEMVDRDLTLVDTVKEMNTSYRTLVMIRDGNKPSTKIYSKICKFLGESMLEVRKYRIE